MDVFRLTFVEYFPDQLSQSVLQGLTLGNRSAPGTPVLLSTLSCSFSHVAFSYPNSCSPSQSWATIESWARIKAKKKPKGTWAAQRLARGVGAMAADCSPSSPSWWQYTPVPSGQPQPGHTCSPLSPPLPSALDFQTESKMGSHQIRFVFPEGNFPFIDSLLSGGTVLLPLSRFFLGIWG